MFLSAYSQIQGSMQLNSESTVAAWVEGPSVLCCFTVRHNKNIRPWMSLNKHLNVSYLLTPFPCADALPPPSSAHLFPLWNANCSSLMSDHLRGCSQTEQPQRRWHCRRSAGELRVLQPPRFLSQPWEEAEADGKGGCRVGPSNTHLGVITNVHNKENGVPARQREAQPYVTFPSQIIAATAQLTTRASIKQLFLRKA